MKTIKNNTEYEIDKDNYNISLAKLLNHYNIIFSSTDYKNSVIDYSMQIGIDIPKNLADFEYRGIGAVCKILLDGQHISLAHIELVNNRLNELSKIVRVKSEVAPIKDKLPTQSNMVPFEIWVEDSIDDVILGKKTDVIDIISKYASYGYNKTDSAKALKFINRYITNLDNDYNDYDTVIDVRESYPNISKTVLKKLVSTLNNFKESISKLSAPKAKKATKKDKPALIQVAKMQYTKDNEEFSLKGIHPKDVIGKSVVYIYDIETRDLIMLNSIAGKFKASGMSYINLDESKCNKKKLRKPKEQLEELLTSLDSTRKTCLDYFDSIKTTQQKSSGRMSENKIIIKVF